MRKNYSDEANDVRTDYSTQSYSSRGVSNKLTYLLVGGGIGAVIALLFAPKSGTELRGDIADVSRKGLDRTRETAGRLREQSGTYYQQLRQQAGDAYSRASEAYRTGADKFRNRTSEQGGNLIGDTSDELSDSGINETGQTVHSNRLT